MQVNVYGCIDSAGDSSGCGSTLVTALSDQIFIVQHPSVIGSCLPDIDHQHPFRCACVRHQVYSEQRAAFQHHRIVHQPRIYRQLLLLVSRLVCALMCVCVCVCVCV
jgi:hypothetical protein